MKLDIDFATRIMEAIENSEKSVIEAEDQLLDGTEPEDENYSYHCLMLSQAGLIEIWPPSNKSMTLADPYRYIAEGTAVARDSRIEYKHRIIAFPMTLTYDGHKFLETVRNEDARSKIRIFLTEKGLPWALSTVKDVGLSYITG